MALKTFKPTTPSQRHLVLVDRSHLWKGKPVKALTEGLSKSGGRNNTGRISVWHRGGGHKRTYRMVDFKRRKRGVPAKLKRVEEKDVPAWLWRSEPAAKRGKGDKSETTGETSAKQVFDRLAGTWTYWGWKGGYFDQE